MTIGEIKAQLQKRLKTKRYEHSLNVMKEAVRLSAIYGGDCEKAALAGLLHDCARDIRGKEALNLSRELGIETDEVSKRQPELLHGPLGSIIAKKEFGIEDKEVLDAIRYHTTGRTDMSLLEKIIFLADYTEPARDFPGVQEIRQKAEKELDEAILAAMNSTIEFVLKKDALLHTETINARNFLLRSKEYEP